jgi:hypothetical protein
MGAEEKCRREEGEEEEEEGGTTILQYSTAKEGLVDLCTTCQ